MTKHVTRADDPDVDGGYAWVVLVAVFVNHVIVDGIMFSFSVFKIEFSNYFRRGDTATALVGSTLSATCLIIGPAAGILANKFGCRAIAVTGSLIATGGFVISAACPSIETLVVTYGLVAGIGLGFLYLPSVVAITFYFEKRRAFATGVALCGTGVGCFVFGPLGGFLVEVYDWRNVMLLVAGISLQGCIFGGLLRPLDSSLEGQAGKRREIISEEARMKFKKLSEDEENHNLENPNVARLGGAAVELDGEYPRMERRPSGIYPIQPPVRRESMVQTPSRKGSAAGQGNSDPSRLSKSETKSNQSATRGTSWFLKVTGLYLLKDPFFLIPLLCNLVASIGLFVPFFYIVSKALELNVSKDKADLLLSIIGMTNTVGRILLGFLADLQHVSTLLLHNAGLIGAGLLCIFSMFAYDYITLCTFCALFGFCYAAWMALTSVMLCELLGLTKLTHAFGLLTLARGTATLIGPVLAGYVYDVTLNYSNAMHVGGFAFLIGGLVNCLLHLPYFQLHKAKYDPDCTFCCPKLYSTRQGD